MQRPAYSKKAFTLIELSIVLVIIGLIVGGVMVGKELINQARLRNFARESETLNTGVNAFRLKYNALPGDMANAEALWGSDASCPAWPTSYNTPKAATCNGNGDGFIDKYVSGPCNGWPSAHEIWRFWQELANASIIQGQYGTSAGATYPCSVQSPASKSFPGLCWSVQHYTSTCDMRFYGTGNVHWFYLNTTVSNAYVYGQPVMTPPDLYSLDAKLDDGLPGTGRIRTLTGFINPDPSNLVHQCSTTLDATTSRYDLTNVQVSCVPLMVASF